MERYLTKQSLVAKLRLGDAPLAEESTRMPPTDDSLVCQLEFAITIAREAGAITLEHFRREGLAVERKSDDSPVTIADRLAEEHLRKRIGEAYPADGIVGEELPEAAGTSGRHGFSTRSTARSRSSTACRFTARSWPSSRGGRGPPA